MHDFDDLEPPRREPELNPNNTKEAAEQMQKEANERPVGGTCIFCDNKVFWIEGDRAWAKGQIYSDSGRDEFRNTSICEFCFDTTTLADREENPELFDHYKALGEARWATWTTTRRGNESA
jgi:hypothetical protein